MTHVTSPASDLPETPELSVVISAYNGEDRLEASLRSVLDQKGPSFEVILINDGSGPKATAILREIAARDRRVRLIEQENTGLTRALIRGCAEARAPIIVRHDADDVSLPRRLAAVAKAFHEHPTAALVTSWVEMRGPRDELLYVVERPRDPEAWRRSLLNERQGPPAHGATAFRKAAYDAVGGYRAAFYYAQDSDLWLRLAERGGTVCVPDVLYAVRVDPRSISGDRAFQQAAYGELGQACRRARAAGKDDSPLLAQVPSIRSQHASSARVGAARSLYFIGACLARRGDKRCMPYLWRAWMYEPWNPRRLVRALLGLRTYFTRPGTRGTPEDAAHAT